jgi:hypothetical protein
MKTAVFSFVRVSENSMVASVRVARFVSRLLDAALFDDEQIAAKPLDLLIIVNGAYGFCKHLPALAEAVLRAKRIVWCQQDYTIIPPKIESKGESPFRAAFRQRHEKGLPHMDFWTTCEDWAGFTPLSRYVNWNALTFDEKYDPKVIARRRKLVNEDLIYYGSFRGGGGRSSREIYFDRYFREPHVPTTISSPAKQFREKYPKCAHFDAIRTDFYDALGKSGLGLYIEDRMSHEHFHSPANRFYEMLSAGLPMVFQPECGTMMRRAGFDPEPYFVRNAREVRSKMDIREEIGRQQRKDWVGDDPGKFRGKLISQIDHAHKVQREALK